MKKKDPISEREYQGRLDLLRRTFNTQLQPLVTQDRNQKAESAEKAGRRKFGDREITVSKTASGRWCARPRSLDQ